MSTALATKPRPSLMQLNQAEARRDPTRTLTIRNRFAREMRRRFDELVSLIRRAVVDQDVFGLAEPRLLAAQLTPPAVGAFAFPRSADKVNAFMDWLREMEQAGTIEISMLPQLGQAVDQHWTHLYVQDSYKRGVMRARYELIRAGYQVPSLDETGGIRVSMSTPFHVDRLGLVFSRTYEDLRGITAQMDTQISRVLAQGLADGDNPIVLAKKLRRTITGPSGDLGLTDTLGRFIPAKRRAVMLARTEVIRSHHLATIQEYRNWSVEGVTVKAEWQTAGDARVCENCAALENRVYDLDEIERMIPLHPQ